MKEFTHSEQSAIDGAPDAEHEAWLKNHYIEGNHDFMGFNSYHDYWRVNTPMDPEHYLCCSECYQRPWNVSFINPEVFANTSGLSEREKMYFEEQKTSVDQIQALEHLGSLKHDWQLSTDDNLNDQNVCSICHCGVWDLHFPGDFDVTNLFE